MANIIEKAEDYVRSATMSMEMLRDKLSEFLAVERGGLKLYDEAIKIVHDSEVSRKFEVFRDQTCKHETILMRVMEQLGMDGAYLSPAAKVAQQKANGLLSSIGLTPWKYPADRLVSAGKERRHEAIAV